jgi:hypothetical protein
MGECEFNDMTIMTCLILVYCIVLLVYQHVRFA